MTRVPAISALCLFLLFSVSYPYTYVKPNYRKDPKPLNVLTFIAVGPTNAASNGVKDCHPAVPMSDVYVCDTSLFGPLYFFFSATYAVALYLLLSTFVTRKIGGKLFSF